MALPTLFLLIMVLLTPLVAWRGGPFPNYPMAIVALVSIVWTIGFLREVNETSDAQEKDSLYNRSFFKLGGLYLFGWVLTILLMRLYSFLS